MEVIILGILVSFCMGMVLIVFLAMMDFDGCNRSEEQKYNNENT